MYDNLFFLLKNPTENRYQNKIMSKTKMLLEYNQQTTDDILLIIC